MGVSHDGGRGGGRKTLQEGLLGAELEYAEVKSQIISAREEFERQCQLHREEEMNLYYQCTQNDINNYALHHFGGEVRSYPRWVKEYNVCIDHIHRAKTLQNAQTLNIEAAQALVKARKLAGMVKGSAEGLGMQSLMFDVGYAMRCWQNSDKKEKNIC